MAADTAKMTAEMERDKYKMMYEEATAVPSVGTEIGAAGRAQASRIVNSVTDAVEAMAASPSTLTPANQARMPMTKRGISVMELMRTDDGVTFNINEGTVVRMAHTDTAADAAMELTGWQGAALAETGGGVAQEAAIYTDIDKSVTAFSAKYPYPYTYTLTFDDTVTTGGTSKY